MSLLLGLSILLYVSLLLLIVFEVLTLNSLMLTYDYF